MSTILETRNLSFQYPDDTAALKDVSVKIESGKKVAFLGPNGAGKSTLFLHLNGILKPSQGRILFKGREIKYNRSSLMELRRNIGIVFQDADSQLFSANVFQEVSFGPLNLGLPEQEVRARVTKALADTDISHLVQKPTHFLSYGQKKRVSIAGILAMEPSVIILDEPTSSLDPYHGKQLMDLIDELSRRGTTVILSTHDIEMAYAWAESIYVMLDGMILKEGVPEELFQDEPLLKKAGLCKPLILEIYQEFKKWGYFKEEIKPPRNKKQLSQIIEALAPTIKD